MPGTATKPVQPRGSSALEHPQGLLGDTWPNREFRSCPPPGSGWVRELDLADLMADRGWHDVVAKPVVGAGVLPHRSDHPIHKRRRLKRLLAATVRKPGSHGAAIHALGGGLRRAVTDLDRRATDPHAIRKSPTRETPTSRSRTPCPSLTWSVNFTDRHGRHPARVAVCAHRPDPATMTTSRWSPNSNSWNRRCSSSRVCRRLIDWSRVSPPVCEPASALRTGF